MICNEAPKLPPRSNKVAYGLGGIALNSCLSCWSFCWPVRLHCLSLLLRKGLPNSAVFFGKVVLQCLIAIVGVLPLTNSIEPNGTSGRPIAISFFGTEKKETHILVPIQQDAGVSKGFTAGRTALFWQAILHYSKSALDENPKSAAKETVSDV